MLRWPAAEVAELLGTTTTAVNSALRRARAQLADAMPAEDELAEPDDAAQRAVLDRFAAAIEGADAAALAELLRADAVLEMPPFLTWFAGRAAVAGFVGSQLLTAPGDLRLVPAAANGQPAFAVYQRGDHGVYRAHALQVLTLTASGIARIVVFADPGGLRLVRPAAGVPGDSGRSTWSALVGRRNGRRSTEGQIRDDHPWQDGPGDRGQSRHWAGAGRGSPAAWRRAGVCRRPASGWAPG